ncbi:MULTISPECIES: response regulator [Flavobacterium]|jgi:CheY-like chemotaxis protein|uniref:Regulator of RpoS n=1 Tax=Flavobacterium anhuiense TaxID=459526 RepID=A0AAC9GIW4_9FLAO|nr:MULTISPECIES: response regulator [Flavobacterium]AOC95723.1 Regulator of RpoS [Flavobacterium anhuiense]EJF99610.1 response regulator receiver protein [Flavobacterium sp. F52]MXO05143.1 response regulator [Flavobacterium sp. HBTb2-11-1]URM36900.1 response regulator [Flavobacterium anhuiense]SCY68744.1 Response regulator receiver domain-containing protein [Flavobacterium anhuiense]
MLEQILCIDDDPITLMLCKKVVSKSSFSHEVVTAQNGEEALHHFNVLKYTNDKARKRPELIFLDLNMPIMGGWEFLDHFTSPDYREFNMVPVIVLSSTIDPEDLAKAKKYPIIVDFLSKPITQPMLEYLKRKIDL